MGNNEVLTTMSPKEYEDDELESCELRIRELEQKVSILESILENHTKYTQEAVEKAESIMNVRLEGMNEFRNQLKDQTKTFATIESVEPRLRTIESRLSSIDKDIALLGEHGFKLTSLRELIDNRISFMQLSVEKSEKELNYRLNTMNEFREAMGDQAKTYLTVDVYNTAHRALETKIDTLRDQISKVVGMEAYNVNNKALEAKLEALNKFMWGALAIVGFLTFAIPIMLHFVTVQ
jgi:chromosome segregation ATPase